MPHVWQVNYVAPNNFVFVERIEVIGPMVYAQPVFPIRMCKKSDSKLMRILGWFIGLFMPSFMAQSWTTIGNTIYVPTKHDNDEYWGNLAWVDANEQEILREAVHVHQYKRMGMISFCLLYFGLTPFLLVAGVLVFGIAAGLPHATAHEVYEISLGLFISATVLMPMTFGLAQGRWYLKREAFLQEVLVSNEPEATIKRVVNTIEMRCGFPWPKTLMTKWFTDQRKAVGGD